MATHECRPPLIAPLLLRLALGVTFIWAGVGKLMTQDYHGAAAGAIASMGEGTIIDGQWPPTPPVPSAPPAATTPVPPAGSPDSDSGGDTTPGTIEDAVEEAGDAIKEAAADLADAVSDTQTPGVTTEPVIDESLTVRARRVMGLAAMLKMSADGNDDRSRLIPKALGTDGWVKTLAWAAVATEVLAGAAMIFGLFTRLAALGIIGSMGTALWLTQIGPAVRTRTGDAFLGFLPPPEMASPMWTQVWNTMLWQIGLLAMAGAILLIGAGRLSLDAWVFGTRREHAAAGKKTTTYATEAPSRPRRPDHTDH